MMRTLCLIGLCLSSLCGLVACGQSGALMLPSDPNYDKRSEYLLYKKDKQTVQETQSSSQPSDQDLGSQQ
ncbi:hypothetical protein CAP51_00805 [Acinetobacter populi]|uniref:Lipoprotein n=2 Tax=Moraxellaceae TaxID=468 RepID=A0A1Z9Z3Y4_9GAMM|nr:hypothetical protein [Acinetobacter populi]MCH4248273.1 hypothetical protein [Acinetobacter populi]OUY09191.1 hypothetical protein CAP51_00805 [Acinetobacter populi]